jgi:hypothetical protein
MLRGLLFWEKPSFSGDFRRPNLRMRENVESKSFQQALIPKELQIICKVSKGIYTPQGYTGGRGCPKNRQQGTENRE